MNMIIGVGALESLVLIDFGLVRFSFNTISHPNPIFKTPSLVKAQK